MFAHSAEEERSPTKLKFSEKEVTYSYRYSKIFDTSVEFGDLKAKELEPDPESDKTEFASEADAILCTQNRKKQEFEDRWIQILPKLELLKLKHMTVDEMLSMELKIIEELDRIRQVNPETGELDETEDYDNLEETLLLLHEACRCISELTHYDNQSTASGTRGLCPNSSSDIVQPCFTDLSNATSTSDVRLNKDEKSTLPKRKKGFGHRIKVLFSCLHPVQEAG
jgi:hypothetical protein